MEQGYKHLTIPGEDSPEASLGLYGEDLEQFLATVRSGNKEVTQQGVFEVSSTNALGSTAVGNSLNPARTL